MGRYYIDKRDVVEDYLQLNLAKLREWGYLHPSSFHSGSVQWTRSMSGSKSTISIQVSTTDPDDMYVRLVYTNTNHSGEKKDFDYKVPLTTTPCNYGGERYWFVCPLSKNGVQCGRRVAKLYGGAWFGCRHCHDLSYASRNEPPLYRGYPFCVITNENKVEALYGHMKRRTYQGKPTKAYQRILRLEHQNMRMGGSDNAWYAIERSL